MYHISKKLLKNAVKIHIFFQSLLARSVLPCFCFHRIRFIKKAGKIRGTFYRVDDVIDVTHTCTCQTCRLFAATSILQRLALVRTKVTLTMVDNPFKRSHCHATPLCYCTLVTLYVSEKYICTLCRVTLTCYILSSVQSAECTCFRCLLK